MALKEQDIVLTTKDASGNTVIQMPITRVENVEGAVKSVNGSTGVVTISDYITSLSVSGKVITYTKKDGTTGTINTQDTNTSNWTISKGANGWARDNTTGLTIQWGKIASFSTPTTTVSFPRTFTTVYGVQLTPIQTSQADGYATTNYVYTTPSNSSFKFYCYEVSVLAGGVYWYAIGIS